MKGRDPQSRLSTRLMIMLVAEPPPRASQRPSNHSSSHGANSNIRAARAGAPSNTTHMSPGLSVIASL